MSTIDWSVLSGPRVSRRTLMKLGAATGAAGFVARMSRYEAALAAPRAQEAKQGGTLKVGFNISQIVTLDPAKLSQGVVAGSVLPNIHSSLVQFDQQLGLIPDLADNWEVTPDGLQYTFKLRPGLTFHNGDTLTAADFAYTFQRTTNPDVASPHAGKLGLVTDFSTPDDLTVSITLSAPFAPFLAVACSRGPGRALTPISKRALEEMGEEQFGISPVGSGPFMIEAGSAEVGKGLNLVPFEAWYGGRPLLDKVEIQLVPEVSSAVSGLEAGDLDAIDPLPATAYDQLSGNPDVTIVSSPSTMWRGLAMNIKRAPWDNRDARLAVAKALDKNGFVEKAFFGRALPGYGAIAPAFGWAYIPADQIQSVQAFNLDEAKALAEQTGILGNKPVIISSEEIGQRPTEVLRTMLTDLGLDPQVDFQQAATFNERWQTGDFDMFLHGSVVDADPDDGHWNHFHSTGPWNTYGYNNPEADRLLEATRQTNDQAERARLFQELQTLLQNDVAVGFAYHVDDLIALNKDVQGWTPVPEQRYYERVWLDR